MKQCNYEIVSFRPMDDKRQQTKADVPLLVKKILRSNNNMDLQRNSNKAWTNRLATMTTGMDNWIT